MGVTAPVISDNQALYTPGISEYRAWHRSFYHSGIKNVGAQTNHTGAIVGTREYDAFGNVDVLSSTGTFRGPFGYGGAFGYREDASGLNLLGHRLYDPAAGRFLSRDPARDGWNWYAYCGNDPLNGADPDGLNPLFGAAQGMRDGIPFLDSFREENDAAEAILDFSLLLSDATGHEWGGYIWTDGNRFFASPPRTDRERRRVRPILGNVAPPGLASFYHTHPWSDNIQNAVFSPEDREWIWYWNAPFYLIDGITHGVRRGAKPPGMIQRPINPSSGKSYPLIYSPYTRDPGPRRPRPAHMP